MECNTVGSLHHRCPFTITQPNYHSLKLKPVAQTSFNCTPKSSLFIVIDRCRTNAFSIANNKNKNIALSLLTRASTEEGTEGVQVSESSPEEIISGEWPDNFALLNYEDLRAYLEPEIFKDKMQPSALLGEVMSSVTRTATVDQTIEEIDQHFEFVSGLPVVDDAFVCIGVVSKKDKQRASNGLKSKVAEIMSSPAVVLTPDKTVLDAAILMLKEKFHRIPIVNENGQVVGIVTRTDIFKALEGLPE